MFFRDTRGFHYPISNIEHFRTTYDDDSSKILEVRLADHSGTIIVKGPAVQSIEYAGAPTVPAAAGTLYLGLVDLKTVWFEPVLAWIVLPDDEPVAITPHGPNAGTPNDFAIVHPNGSVSVFEEFHADVRAFLLEKGFDETQLAAALQEYDTARR